LTDDTANATAQAVRMSMQTIRGLTTVGRASTGHPHTLRLERRGASSNAAYRRLAAVILRLDVESLGRELRAQRPDSSRLNAA
jgi:hypothetical protein